MFLDDCWFLAFCHDTNMAFPQKTQLVCWEQPFKKKTDWQFPSKKRVAACPWHPSMTSTDICCPWAWWMTGWPGGRMEFQKWSIQTHLSWRLYLSGTATRVFFLGFSELVLRWEMLGWDGVRHQGVIFFFSFRQISGFRWWLWVLWRFFGDASRFIKSVAVQNIMFFSLQEFWKKRLKQKVPFSLKLLYRVALRL